MRNFSTRTIVARLQLFLSNDELVPDDYDPRPDFEKLKVTPHKALTPAEHEDLLLDLEIWFEDHPNHKFKAPARAPKVFGRPRKMNLLAPRKEYTPVELKERLAAKKLKHGDNYVPMSQVDIKQNKRAQAFQHLKHLANEELSEFDVKELETMYGNLLHHESQYSEQARQFIRLQLASRRGELVDTSPSEELVLD